MILGCFMRRRIVSSLRVRSASTLFLKILVYFLIAYIFPVYLCLTRQTSPYAPYPTMLICRKRSSYICCETIFSGLRGADGVTFGSASINQRIILSKGGIDINNESINLNMNSSELIEQLSQYMIELTKIEELIQRQDNCQQHLHVLKEKISMKNNQFKQVMHQLNMKQHSPAALSQMSIFFKQSFTQVIKQAHRLIQIKCRPQSQERLSNKISLIKEMQDEMGNIWQDRKEKKSDGVMKRLNENISMLSEQLDQSQLKSIAKTYLHKEFLAIRMIAYKLYEKYVGHSHSSFHQHLQEIKQEQADLQNQIEEMKDVNKELKSEEKRLMRELNELKKINDIIGKRYFVQDDRLSHN